MQSVCVFCGSNSGARPEFIAAASSVGRLLAESGRTLVYGGGRVGMMGAVADAAIAAGGRVIGVIPQALVDKELAHSGAELRIVQSMHERKALMAELSDAFLTLPGGIGTLEEFFETWTWGQLGLHTKPYAVLDVEGLFEPMLSFLDRLVEQQFLRPEHREMLLVGKDPSELIAALASHHPGFMPKWIDRQDT